ncbi:hypothetical protein Tco_0679123 [Tanacetum coccineum]|uniref:Uncharacterized protein n=1 Tax=Tanacetum coccineum TaxID=301880 RepID=A0ABQ4XH77_9ASTR
MYYEIIRANGSTKSYKIFTKMLDDFDRQDVLDLYRLVKERLFDSCGIHVLLRLLGLLLYVGRGRITHYSRDAFKNAEWEGRGENESEMAFELLRFTRSHIEK